MCLAEAMKEARMASIETTKSRRSHVRLDFLASSHKKNKKREEEEEEEGKKQLCLVSVGLWPLANKSPSPHFNEFC